MAMSSGNGQTITVCGNVFRLVETIGQGSYGTVHKAINLSSGAAVAVKLIGKDKLRRPHERRSIEKEIETMRVAVEQFENGHPHIVRLLCTKESQQHIFIVLEYCAGGDLAAVMKTQRGLTEEQARVYLSQLATGLQFLRSQNVVHRDLKPANLLLSSKNRAHAKLKIADFGFARELQSESMAESVVGSPLYMAPELLEYKSYDAKADLWSVGIILYEMLVNDHPFLVVNNVHATNHLALRRNIHRYFENNKHVSLPKHIHVSPDCEALLRGLLCIDPRERISFENFFRAPFLLPPPPTDAEIDAISTEAGQATLSSSADESKQALVAEPHAANDWATFSDEYVIVDKEYEDVGRHVLNREDLKTDMDGKHADKEAKYMKEHTKEPPMTTKPETSDEHLQDAQLPETVADQLSHLTIKPASGSPPPTQPATDLASMPTNGIATSGIVDVVVDTSTPRANGSSNHVSFSSPSVARDGASPRHAVSARKQDAVTLARDPRDWVTDDNRLEEMLGICYKSFSCGSVGLFVPTPFGDYIAFHEGCPHYYLSMESIEACKRDGRNPPYVLGCIVFIEDYVASTEGNPYCLREGTAYHIVTVTPLSSNPASSSAPDSSDATTPNQYGDLPLSQALAPRTLPIEQPEPPKPTSGFFSSLSSYLGQSPPAPSVAVPPPAPLSPPPGVSSFEQKENGVTGNTLLHQRISFRSFQISHLALFFLKGGKLPYVAFNDGVPNYYLASESIQAARDGDTDDKSYPAYILGEIIFIDTFQATEDFNPYRLSYGTRFHVVTVANPKRT